MDVLTVTMLVGSTTIAAETAWQPSFEPGLTSDSFSMLGFGLRDDGTAYYDPQGADSNGTSPGQTSERAQVGLALMPASVAPLNWVPRSAVPVMTLTRVLPPNPTASSPPRLGFWNHEHPPVLLGSTPKPAYWTAPHPEPLINGGPQKPDYWMHEHPPEAPLVPTQPVTRFV